MSNSSFEGFDYGNNYHLTEKEEKNESWEQKKIWVIVGLLMALCLGLTIYMHSKELMLKYNGNSIVTEYKNGSSGLEVQDDQGTNHFINLSNTIISNQDGKITLYYYGSNIASAKALTAIWFWIMMYSVWIPLFSVCVYLIFKNTELYKKIKQRNLRKTEHLIKDTQI